ncbi:MAG: DNA-processing protein DprA, partial [Actinocatenispora sp.]
PARPVEPDQPAPSGPTGPFGSASADGVIRRPGTGSGDRDEVRAARIALSWLCEPGHRALGQTVRVLGPVAALRRIIAGRAPESVRTAVAARLGAADPWRMADRLADEGRRLGCRLLTPEDEEWPRQLDDLVRIGVAADGRRFAHTDPPLCLWVRGEPTLNTALDRAVAVVGSRASTSYGNHVAGEFAYGLAGEGWTVVSGGAYGIDAAAHRGALGAGEVTVAVLACGVDVVYPVGHASLFERIGDQGLLISEWPPGTTPHRHRFLIRNRVIAALCRGTVVVEASARSGARNTARRTRQLGRSLMAVPGPVTSGMSVGPHVLMREEDARLVTSVAEILEEVGRIGEDLAPVPRGPVTPRDDLDDMSIRVLDAVPLGRPGTVEEIAVEAGVHPVQVRRTLPMLALLGFVLETPTGYRIADERQRPPPTR